MMTTKEDKDFEDQIERMKLKNQLILDKFRASEEDRRWAESSGSVINKDQNVQIRAKVMNDPPKLRISQGARQRPKSVHGNIHDDGQYSIDSNDQFKENRKGNRYRNHDKMVYYDFMNFQQAYNGNNNYNKKPNGYNRQHSYNDDGRSSNYNFIQQLEKKYFGGNQRKNSFHNNNESSLTLSARFSKSNQRLNSYNYDSNSYNKFENNQRNNYNNNNNSNNKNGRNRKKSKNRNNNNQIINGGSKSDNNQTKSNQKNPQNTESNNSNTAKKPNGYKNKPANKTNAKNDNTSMVFDDEYFDDTLDDLEKYRLKVDLDDFIVIDPDSKDPILIKPLEPWSNNDHVDNEIGGDSNYSHFNDGHQEKDDRTLDLSTVKERAKDYLSLGHAINPDNLHCSDSEDRNIISPLPNTHSETVPLVLDTVPSNQEVVAEKLEAHQKDLPEAIKENSSAENKQITESSTKEDNTNGDADTVKADEADPKKDNNTEDSNIVSAETSVEATKA